MVDCVGGLLDSYLYVHACAAVREWQGMLWYRASSNCRTALSVAAACLPGMMF
jgi:hypothetical protein